jgi:hypothetical protein
METINHSQGTILRFRGIDGKKVHMGFVFDETKVMELVDKGGLCNICVTDINKPHPLIERPPLTNWSHHESPPFGWSVEKNIEMIVSAHKQFHGTQYNKIHNNCQHFVYSAVWGYRKSPDVEAIPSWLVDLGIAEMFTGASEASSASSAALVREYAKDAIKLIQALQKAAKLTNSSSSSKSALKNFSGIVDSAESLLKLFGK